MNENNNNTPTQEHTNDQEHTIAAHVANHQHLEDNNQDIIGPQLPPGYNPKNNQEMKGKNKQEESPTPSR